MLGGFFAGALLVGMIKEKFFSKPAKDAAEVGKMQTAITTLESKIAVIEATRLTEAQVRNIVHEQVQPMKDDINQILQHQTMQGKLLARIEERLSKQERQ